MFVISVIIGIYFFTVVYLYFEFQIGQKNLSFKLVEYLIEVLWFFHFELNNYKNYNNLNYSQFFVNVFC